MQELGLSIKLPGIVEMKLWSIQCFPHKELVMIQRPQFCSSRLCEIDHERKDHGRLKSRAVMPGRRLEIVAADIAARCDFRVHGQ